MAATSRRLPATSPEYLGESRETKRDPGSEVRQPSGAIAPRSSPRRCDRHRPASIRLLFRAAAIRRLPGVPFVAPCEELGWQASAQAVGPRGLLLAAWPFSDHRAKTSL